MTSADRTAARTVWATKPSGDRDRASG